MTGGCLTRPSQLVGTRQDNPQLRESITDECTIVDDGTGIRNNVLVVKPKPVESATTHAPEVQTAQTTREEDIPPPTQAAETQEKHADLADDLENDDDIPESEKNLFKHETVQIPTSTGESDREGEDIDDGDEQDEEPPLFEHEAGPDQRIDSLRVTPSKTGKFDFEDATESPIEIDDFADDERDSFIPLFRHETGTSVESDPDEAPLFRHESMSSPVMSPTMSTSSFSPSSRKQRKPAFEDVNDPSLEPFPVDEAGIQARIQRVATRVREDDVLFEGTPPSPSLAQTKSFSPQARPDLLQTESSDLSHLDAIDETEETDEEDTTPAVKLVEKKDSIVQPVPINIKVKDADEIDSTPAFAEIPDISSREPLTPPMTPTEHARAKAVPQDGAVDSKEAPASVGSPRDRKDNVTDHIANRPSPSETPKSVKSTKQPIQEESLASKACVWFIGLCGGKTRAAYVYKGLNSRNFANSLYSGVAVAMGVAAVAIALNSRSA